MRVSFRYHIRTQENRSEDTYKSLRYLSDLKVNQHMQSRIMRVHNLLHAECVLKEIGLDDDDIEDLDELTADQLVHQEMVVLRNDKDDAR